MIDWDKVREEARRGATVLLDDDTLDHFVLLCQYVAAKQGQEMFVKGVDWDRDPQTCIPECSAARHASPLPVRKVEKPREVVPIGGFYGRVETVTHTIGRAVVFYLDPDCTRPWHLNFMQSDIAALVIDLLSNPTETTEEPVTFDVEVEG